MELIEGRLFLLMESSRDDVKRKDLSGDTTINLDKEHKHTTVHKHFGPSTLKTIWKHCHEVDLKIKNFKRVFYLTNNL